MSEMLSNQTSTSGNRLMLVISLLLGGLFLFLALQGLDWAAFIQIVRMGNYAYLFLLFFISSLTYLMRALRWKIFLGAEKKLSLPDVFWANMTGYMGNAYLPARAGELIRSVFLGNKSGLGAGFVLATAITERILDVIALILIGSISLLWQGNPVSSMLVNSIRIMALAGFGGLVLMIIAPFQDKLILRMFRRLPLPRKILDRISDQMIRFFVGMRCIQNWRSLTMFMILTGIIWFTDAFGVTIGVSIISQTLNIGQGLILLSALGLSSVIPVPGNVGVFQFVAVAVLTPFGFSSAQALAYITISQILNYIVVTFWGLLGLWKINSNKPRSISPSEDYNAAKLHNQ